jgi:lactate 2-monooxygenase
MDGRARQTEIYVGGVGGRGPAIPLDHAELERRAEESMTPEAFAYIATGAGAERTVAANRNGFDDWRILPRMLRDVSDRDLSVELFGRRLPAPLLLGPVGVLEMADKRADLAVGRAAAAAGVPYVFSNQASVPMERVAAAMADAPRWFQLYWSTSDELVRSFVARAERSGCEAIVVTLDTTLLGWRTRDLDLAYLPFLRGKGIAQYTSDPVFRRLMHELPAREEQPEPRIGPAALRTLIQLVRAYPDRFWRALRSGDARAAVQAFVQIYSRPSLTWEQLPMLREITGLPILLKGITHPEDARRAIDEGIDGIVVSNHGGRQVDGAIGAIEALPFVTDAVAGRIPVLFDSGIRGGADAFKALALGARAVLVGRPYAYALAIAGVRGVRELIANLTADLDLTLGLAGRARISELDRDCLARVGPPIELG